MEMVMSFTWTESDDATLKPEWRSGRALALPYAVHRHDGTKAHLVTHFLQDKGPIAACGRSIPFPEEDCTSPEHAVWCVVCKRKAGK